MFYANLWEILKEINDAFYAEELQTVADFKNRFEDLYYEIDYEEIMGEEVDIFKDEKSFHEFLDSVVLGHIAYDLWEKYQELEEGK